MSEGYRTIEIPHCPQCGHPINPNETICSNCGYHLQADQSITAPIHGVPPPSALIPGDYSQAPSTYVTQGQAPGTQTRPSSVRGLVIVGVSIILLLLIVVGLLTGLLLSQRGGGGTGVSQTPGGQPGHTVTVASTKPGVTNTPALTPTLGTTLTPTQVPSPTATPEKVLYRADWSHGLDGWHGDPAWGTSDGMLTCPDTGDVFSFPLIEGPSSYQTPRNFAMEFDLRLLHDNASDIFMFFRASYTGTGLTGYTATIADGQLEFRNNTGDPPLAQSAFSYGTDWHSYRVEVKGTSMKFFADGNLITTLEDTAYLNGTRFGIKALRAAIEIKNFRFVALS